MKGVECLLAQQGWEQTTRLVSNLKTCLTVIFLGGAHVLLVLPTVRDWLAGNLTERAAMTLMRISCAFCSWILHSPIKTEHIWALSAVWKWKCPSLISSTSHGINHNLWDFCLLLKLRSDQATNLRVAWGEMSTKRERQHDITGAPLLHKSGQEV